LASPKQEKEYLVIASVEKYKDPVNEVVASFVPFTLPGNTAGNLRKVNDAADPVAWIFSTKEGALHFKGALIGKIPTLKILTYDIAPTAPRTLSGNKRPCLEK
jgi:hypothetical protein